jgi:hypothetical protein
MPVLREFYGLNRIERAWLYTASTTEHKRRWMTPRNAIQVMIQVCQTEDELAPDVQTKRGDFATLDWPDWW